jgi:hypothetical protein
MIFKKRHFWSEFAESSNNRKKAHVSALSNFKTEIKVIDSDVIDPVF